MVNGFWSTYPHNANQQNYQSSCIKASGKNKWFAYTNQTHFLVLFWQPALERVIWNVNGLQWATLTILKCLKPCRSSAVLCPSQFPLLPVQWLGNALHPCSFGFWDVAGSGLPRSCMFFSLIKTKKTKTATNGIS